MLNRFREAFGFVPSSADENETKGQEEQPMEAPEAKAEEEQPMEVPEAKVQEEDAEERDASGVNLLVDLGGRFLRSSLHVGRSDFEDLPTLQMEFVLGEVDMHDFVGHCVQPEVLHALKCHGLNWDPTNEELLEQRLEDDSILDEFWAQLRSMIRPCTEGFDRGAPRFASLKTPMLAQGQTLQAISSLLSHCPDLHRIVDVMPITSESATQQCLTMVSLWKLIALAKTSFKLALDIPEELRKVHLPFPMFVGNLLIAVLEEPLRTHHFRVSSNFDKVLISAPEKRSVVANAEYQFMLKWVFRNARQCTLESETHAGAAGCNRQPNETATILDIGSTNFKLTASTTSTEESGARSTRQTLIDSFHMVQRDDACLRLVDPDMVGEISQHVFRRLHQNVAFALIKRAKILTYFYDSCNARDKTFERLSNLLVGDDIVAIEECPKTPRYKLLSKLADQSWLAEECDGEKRMITIPTDAIVKDITPRSDGTDHTMAFHQIELLMLQLVDVGEYVKHQTPKFDGCYLPHAHDDCERFKRSIDDLQDDYATFREISTLTEKTLVFGSQGSSGAALSDGEKQVLTALLYGLDERAPVKPERFVKFARNLLGKHPDNIITIVGKCAEISGPVGKHLLDQSNLLGVVKQQMADCMMMEDIARSGFQSPVQAVLRQALAAYIVLLVKAVIDLRYSWSLARQRATAHTHKVYLLGAINTGGAFKKLMQLVIKQHLGAEVEVKESSQNAVINGLKTFVDQSVTGSQTQSSVWFSYVGTLRVQYEVVTSECRPQLPAVETSTYNYQTRELQGNSTRTTPRTVTQDAVTRDAVMEPDQVSRAYFVAAFSLKQDHDDMSSLEIPLARAQFPVPTNWRGGRHRYESVGPIGNGPRFSPGKRTWIFSTPKLDDKQKLQYVDYATIDLLQLAHLHLPGVLSPLTPDTTGWHKSLEVVPTVENDFDGATREDLADKLTMRNGLKSPKRRQESTSSTPAPNGMKVNMMLEELKASVPDFTYDAHKVDIGKGEQFRPEFLEISPNNRIPAIVDPNGPGGAPLSLFESGAILTYLAEKYQLFLPQDAAKRYKTMQWLFWQVGGVGPMFGQFGHFYKYAKEKIPYGIERYAEESKRLLGVLDHQLAGKEFIIGDEYTIADMAVWPWVEGLERFYHGSEEYFKHCEDFRNVRAWLDRIGERPATQRARNVTPIG